MITLIHNSNIIVDVRFNDCSLKRYIGRPIVEGLFEVAKDYVNEIIYWIHEDLSKNSCSLFVDTIEPFEIFSYDTSDKLFMKNEIGYVDSRSPLLNINDDVKYATWLLSSDVGMIYSKTLLIFSNLSEELNFNLFLCNLGKVSSKSGIFTYSHPKLITNNRFKFSKKQCSTNELFYFVKKNYTFKMYIFLFIAFVYYKKEFQIFSFLRNIFKKKNVEHQREVSELFSFTNVLENESKRYDVIIPTLGRPKYLYDFLTDLNSQSILPQSVIIIEQNSEEGAVSQLEYLVTEKWNFNVKHKFVNQLGACNARNLAIDMITSDWVFFADDDIRIENFTVENTISFLIKTKINGASLASFKKGESIDKTRNPFFWNEFSSGCSIVKSEYVLNNYFDMRYEFGFGEDTAYGCNLRQKGCSIIYYNKVTVFHLKAPVGGFRTKIEKSWSDEWIQPFPEPTITKCIMENYNYFQFCGFKLFYLLKGFNYVDIKKKLDLSIKYAIAIK